MRHLLLALLCAAWPHAADAALPPASLAAAGVTLPRDAQFPLALPVRDAAGARTNLGAALAGHPGFVVFADYTCKTLCGPGLVLLGTALARSTLPRESYRIAVIGIDPKDTADDARALRDKQVPEALRGDVSLLLPDAKTLAAFTTAGGFRAVYDPADDQFAHPELVYAVSADGRVQRLLSPFTLTATDMTPGIFTPASDGLYQRLRLICYRFAAASGLYTATIRTALQAAGLVTVLALAGMMAVFARRKRRAP
jgi:protein SCO1/2